MSGAVVSQLLTVADVAWRLAVTTKTIYRWISQGKLVAHKFNRSFRVDVEVVTHLLAQASTRSPIAEEVHAMEVKRPANGVHLHRQRGRGKTWSGLIDGQEVKLGTADREEAEARLTRIAAERARAAPRRREWRAYKDEKGWLIKHYDEQGRRRTQRIPPTAQPPVRCQEDAEAYGRRVFPEQRSAPNMPEPSLTEPHREMSFQQFGEAWTKGELADLQPDYIERKASSDDDRQRLELYVYPTLGLVPMKRLEGTEGRELVQKIQRELARTELSRSTRRQVLQTVNRILNLAAHPFCLIEANPLPRGFLPKANARKAKGCVLPDEDALLMRCKQVPLVERLLFGVLAREGLRVSEALELTWGSLDLEHGMITLDQNKTDDPRSWALDPGVVEALRRWRRTEAKARSAAAKVFVRSDGRVVDRYDAAVRLRDDLRTAGVIRPELFERSEKRLALRAHDLRASFVTVSLAIGKSESWVTDRTGHQSSAMLHKYDRQVRMHRELRLGPFAPLFEAIPELAAAAPPSSK